MTACSAHRVIGGFTYVCQREIDHDGLHWNPEYGGWRNGDPLVKPEREVRWFADITVKS